MIDIKFLRENPEAVKENIRKKFQDSKLPLVDEVIALDEERRKTQQEADTIKAEKNKLSKEIGALMAKGQKAEAEEVKNKVAESTKHLAELEDKQKELEEKTTKIMMVIPNIIDPSVPIGKDDSENVELEQFGTNANYTRTITTTDMACPIDENTRLWIDAPTSGAHDYVVTMVAKSINSITYAVLKVDTL